MSIDNSAFTLPEDPNDPLTYRGRAEAKASADADLEDLLRRYQWFPYRRLSPVDATHEFVKAYDRAMLGLLRKNAEIPGNTRDHLLARGSYLNPGELLAPWMDYKAKRPAFSPRWNAWVSARRSADKRGMIYDDFCAFAAVAALRRGWPRLPTPNSITQKKLLGLDPNDRWPQMTVQGIEAEVYAGKVKLCTDYHFLAKWWVGDELQMTYARYVAREVMRVYGGTQKVDRVWKHLIAQGNIHTSLSLAALLQ